MQSDLREHSENCALLRTLLHERDTENLRNLYWYDLPIHEAVSPAGELRVAEWNRLHRTQDEIAGNYGLTNLYYAPPPGDGLHASAATVWRCTRLASRPWHDEPSPIRDALEQSAPAIIEEYRAVARRLETHPDNASLTERGRWTGKFLYGARGVRNDELCNACPTTAKLLDELPLCKAFGFAMFSGMEPHTHIAPHCGSSNLRLRYHLGLDVPEPDRSWLRVGTEKRGWREGKAMAFDDSFQHEVEHAGERLRVVLVLDVWHPSLTAEDIAVLSHPVFQRFGKVSRAAAAAGPDAD